MGGDGVCAHWHRCPRTGRLVLFTTRIYAHHVHVRVFELGKNSFLPVVVAEFSHPGFTHFHDFCFTARHYIFFAADMRFDAASFALGRSAVASTSHAGGDTLVYIVPRGPGQTRVTRVPRCFVTHFVNAYEEEDALVVDCVAADTVSGDVVPDVRARRYMFENAGSSSPEFCMYAALFEGMCDFPALDPRVRGKQHRYAYFAGRGAAGMALDRWVKCDTWTGRCVSAQLLVGAIHLEPVFVPYGPAEEEGYLVGFGLREGKPFMGVVDAASMTAVAVLDTPGANELGLHGAFVRT